MEQAQTGQRPNHRAHALMLLRLKPVIRTRDFSEAGIPRIYLQRLVHEGLLVQISRGLYEAADRPLSRGGSLAEIAAWSPRAKIALLSALQFHGLTAQAPHEVWVLLGLKEWAPQRTPTKLHIVRAGGEALTAGIGEHFIDGVCVHVTNPAKTIADCFKFRSRVGLDVAIDALRDGLRRNIVTIEALLHDGQICRVQPVMRPYVQAMV